MQVNPQAHTIKIANSPLTETKEEKQHLLHHHLHHYQQNKQDNEPANQAVSELRSLLSLTIQETNLTSQQPVVVLECSESIERSFEIISSLHVLCAPVYDRTAGKFVGMLDIKDFVVYVLSLCGKLEWPGSMKTLPQTVKELLAITRHSPFVVVDHKKTVLELFRVFDRGLHRIVVDGNIPYWAEQERDVQRSRGESPTLIPPPGLATGHKPLVAVRSISQLAIVKWLHENRNRLTQINKSIGELHVGGVDIPTKHVISINETQTALDAFIMIHKNNIYGMSIVDAQNKVVGNISVTDLKYAVDNIDRLSLPLHAFFEVPRPLYTCTRATPLMEAIALLSRTQVHRLHVVDHEGKLCGIVTLTDILDMVYALATDLAGCAGR